MPYPIPKMFPFLETAWKTPLEEGRIHRGAILRSLRRYYCPEMLRRALCTKECADCEVHLALIARQAQKGQARSLSAVLVWVIRDYLAGLAEKPLPRIQPNLNQFGEELPPGNPFTMFMGTLTQEEEDEKNEW